MRLTTIVPAYRQEHTIVEDIRNIDQALQSLGIDYEILVVVDGFVDGTYERAKTMESTRTRVLGYARNAGKGHAVRLGMQHATGDLVAFLDAGMDLDPGGLAHCVAIIEETGVDIVVGSKRHPQSLVHYPALRRCYSAMYQALVWVLFGLNVRDTQVGLKVFRRQVINDVEPLLLVKRFAFDVELLVVARLMGYTRISEAPITLNHGRFPSSIRARSIIEMLWDTMAVYYRARILRYYQRLQVQRTAEAEEARTSVAAGELVLWDQP